MPQICVITSKMCKLLKGLNKFFSKKFVAGQNSIKAGEILSFLFDNYVMYYVFVSNILVLSLSYKPACIVQSIPHKKI